MKDEDLSIVVQNLIDIFPPLFKKTFKQGKFIKKSDMTPVLFGILNLLYHEEKLTLSQISERKAITSSNCSRAVNKLTEKGYTSRKIDQEDRRKARISLTKKGENYVENIQQNFEEEIKKQLSTLNNEEIQTLKEASEDIYKILSKIL